MYQVTLSDPAYEVAKLAAARSGRSVEAFVEEAVRQLADDEAPIVLTPEQAKICAQAEADIDAGNFFTAEQVREHFAQKRAASMRGDED
ncbi:MAG: hypothetical protein ACO1SV_14820 [Fimbriimonas sp.]